MNRSLALVCALFVGLLFGGAACGGDDDDDGGGAGGGGPGNSCTGTELTEEKLCQLTCAQTTEAQTQAAFGPPTTSGSGLLQYTYSCMSSTPGSANFITWSFYYSNGVLANVSHVGSGSFSSVTDPACLSACKQ